MALEDVFTVGYHARRLAKYSPGSNLQAINVVTDRTCQLWGCQLLNVAKPLTHMQPSRRVIKDALVAVDK